MKKIILILSLLALLFVFSCNNSNSDNSDIIDSTSNTVVDNNDNSDLNQSSSDVQTIQIKAQFQGIVLGSAGAVTMFTDANGKEYVFKDDGNQQLHDLFADVDPTDPNDMTHNGEWYNISYKEEIVQQYNGGSGEYEDVDKLFIVTIELVGGNITTGVGNAITLQTLKNALFFGTEADFSWTLKFSDDKIIFTPAPGETPYDVLYYYDENTCFSSISDDEVQIKATTDMDRAYIWTITIKREPCSDGMSDNTYPYSIHIQWEDSVGYGCGRDL